jgi:hypothetical protein
VDADGDLLVSQEKSATKESLWDIVASILLFPKIKLLTGVILNLVEEYLHHVIDHVTPLHSPPLHYAKHVWTKST